MSRQTVKNRTHSLKEMVVDVPLTRSQVDELHFFMDEDHAKVHGDKGKKNVMVALFKGLFCDETVPRHLLSRNL